MRILFVDDSSVIRETFAGILRDRGHDVVEAVDGTDGLFKFKKGEYDLVISDLNMPIRDGIWLVEQIRKGNEQVKVVGFTGSVVHEEIKSMYKAGVERIYPKDCFSDICEDHSL